MTEPKRPPTAYLLFDHSIREAVSSEFPQKKAGEIRKVTSSKWKQLSAEAKASFVEEAKRLKVEYKLEVERYMQTDQYKAYRAQLDEWQMMHGTTTSNSATPVSSNKKPKDRNCMLFS